MPDPDSLPVSRGTIDIIGVDRMLFLRGLLEAKAFDQLNMALGSYQDSFEADPLEEYKLFSAYNALAITDPDYEDLMYQWIDASPEYYQPYLALGRYYCLKGWESRGTKYMRETSETQIEGMEFYFGLSEDNILHALEINPNLIVAYHVLIDLYNAGGDNASENDIIAKSMERFPYSSYIANAACWAKYPRWGGSYAEIAKIANVAQEHADVNPRLTLCYGRIYFDQGRILNDHDRSEEAIEMFERALDYGDSWDLYYKIANIYCFGVNDYDAALEYVNESIELRPDESDNYLLKAKILFYMGDYDGALYNLEYAEIIDPWDENIRSWREWASKSLINQAFNSFANDRQQALEKYSLAADFDKQNGEVHYWEGVSYLKAGEFDSALSALNRSIDANPSHFESYRMIDNLLAKNGKWEEIIEYWDQFLMYEPEHAEAYFERSGTYYHMGDMTNAMADLEKACQLGCEDACRQYDAVSK